MLNILIISDEAKDIAALFRSTGFTPDTRDLKQASAAEQTADETSEQYEIAFLDLDAENWQGRLLDARLAPHPLLRKGGKDRPDPCIDTVGGKTP